MKRAFSLSITLFITMVLIGITSYFLYVNKENLKITFSLNDKLSAYLQAFSMSEKLKFYLATGKSKNFYIENRVLNLPLRVRVDNYKYKIDNIEFKIQDANGLLSMIYINIDTLVKLSRSKNFSILKDSLLDWLDTDDLTRLNGAERLFYIKNGYKYIPRNKNFLAFKDEIVDIRNWDNSFNKIKNDLIFSLNYSNNYLTMSKDLLKAKYKNVPSELFKKAEKLKLKLKNNELISLFQKSLNLDYEIDMPFISNIFLIDIKSFSNDAVYKYKEVVDISTLTTLYVINY